MTEQSPDSPKRTQSEQTEHAGRVKALEDHIETLKAQLGEEKNKKLTYALGKESLKMA